MKNKINRVLVFDTVYPLLIFLLITDEQEYFKTKFILRESSKMRFNSESLDVLYLKTWLLPKKNKNRFWGWINLLLLSFYYRFLFLKRYFIWKEINKAELFVHELGVFDNIFISYREYNLIEDGIQNYEVSSKKLITTKQSFNIKKSILNNIVNFPNRKSQINNIYLTRGGEEGKKVKMFYKAKKLKLVNLQNLWDSSTNEKRNLIKHFFFIEKEDIDLMMQKKILILTQPLSEDGFISENCKISMYKKIIDENPKKDIIIKTHPREKTDYKLLFPDISIMKKNIPAELFNLLNIKYEKVFTISSTAALSFKEKGAEVIQIECDDNIIGYKEFRYLIKKEFSNHSYNRESFLNTK